MIRLFFLSILFSQLLFMNRVHANPALFDASERNDLNEVNRLLLEDPTVNVNFVSTFDGTALSIAARNGHYKIVKRLLSVPKVNVNFEDFHAPTALTLAITNNHIKIVKTLLRIPGIQINGKGCRGGALEAAVAQANNNASGLTALINHGGLLLNKCGIDQSINSLQIAYRNYGLLDLNSTEKNSNALKLLLAKFPELLKSEDEVKSIVSLAACSGDATYLSTVLSYPELKSRMNIHQVVDFLSTYSAWGFKTDSSNLVRVARRYIDFNLMSDDDYLTWIFRILDNGDVESLKLVLPLRKKLINHVFVVGKQSWLADNQTAFEFADARTAISNDPRCGQGFGTPEPCMPTGADYVAMREIILQAGGEPVGIYGLVAAAEKNDLKQLKRIVALAPSTGLDLNADRTSSVLPYFGTIDGAVLTAAKSESLESLQYLLSISTITKNSKAIFASLEDCIYDDKPKSVRILLTIKGLDSIEDQNYSRMSDMLSLLDYAKKLNRTEIVQMIELYISQNH